MKTKAFLTSLLAVAVAIGASAQSYYDDDIYYDASKDTKAKQEIAAHKKAVEQERIRQQQQRDNEMAYWRAVVNQSGNYNPELGGDDYAAADTYALPGTGSARNVDEYNRRGAYAPSAQYGDSTAGADDFAYTRRIERFHNGDVIASANDPDLVDYYYAAEQSQPDVNIYLVSPGWSSWWGPSWYYDPWYYDPWWPRSYWSWNYWGPSWSWGWNSWYGWNFGFSWGWGPSWAWGGPCWGWGGHHYGWGGHGWGGGWAYNPGNYAPQGRQSTGVRNGYTGLSSRVGSPFGGSRGRAGSNVSRQSLGNYRPGGSSSSSAAVAGNSNGSYRPGASSTYTAPSKSGNSSNSNSSTSVRRTTRSSSSSSSSYNSSRSSSSSSRSSSGWSSGGSSSSRSSGGGGGGGGHSSRGGRR